MSTVSVPRDATALVQHPLVDKAAFTGDRIRRDGDRNYEDGRSELKNITLEMGGKSPLLVFNDADLEQVVRWSHFGIMSNRGQICTATSRIIVQKDIIYTFV